jgi:hypothetical protein
MALSPPTLVDRMTIAPKVTLAAPIPVNRGGVDTRGRAPKFRPAEEIMRHAPDEKRAYAIGWFFS